jgi:hypothetical protein
MRGKACWSAATAAGISPNKETKTHASLEPNVRPLTPSPQTVNDTTLETGAWIIGPRADSRKSARRLS